MSMTDEEILIRLREASIANSPEGAQSWVDAIRSGANDSWFRAGLGFQALRDAHKPLAEIVPLCPDLKLARECAAAAYHPDSPAARDIIKGELDHLEAVKAARIAVERMRELAK